MSAAEANPTAPRSSSAKIFAVAWRSAGARASARITTASSCGGHCGHLDVTFGMGSSVIAFQIAKSVAR